MRRPLAQYTECKLQGNQWSSRDSPTVCGNIDVSSLLINKAIIATKYIPHTNANVSPARGYRVIQHGNHPPGTIIVTARAPNCVTTRTHAHTPHARPPCNMHSSVPIASRAGHVDIVHCPSLVSGWLTCYLSTVVPGGPLFCTKHGDKMRCQPRKQAVGYIAYTNYSVPLVISVQTRGNNSSSTRSRENQQLVIRMTPPIAILLKEGESKGLCSCMPICSFHLFSRAINQGIAMGTLYCRR
ncbi:hypothetical protein J6590_044032 [Homalodisca vitripennis]|nr:hypothetical protein J6590_044032 [Homalodisca vitripennis]